MVACLLIVNSECFSTTGFLGKILSQKPSVDLVRSLFIVFLFSKHGQVTCKKLELASQKKFNLVILNNS